ncbi:MAG: 50S ribosomal protein L21 [Chlamydiia bacterium]|nr:50S ribosomal protein L21 [Chlamydiia bacterium]MCH9616167.1 50S ribosomal protein L21 [Chlamydiia bacterium]MCH9629847.1 50S ribosomal protein L21 [Chlamydiia bacterium]
MEAIIETGNQQFRVKKGDVIDIELIEAGKSGSVDFKNVLLINDGKAIQVGAPHVSGYAVKGKLVEEVAGPKVVNFKYKRRKNYRRTVGHRQKYSRVKITSISKPKAKKEEDGA